jgi:ATP-dependent 26S proteasome regulatory subunit
MKRQHFDTTVRKLTVAERDVSSDVGYLAQSFRQLERALEQLLRALWFAFARRFEHLVHFPVPRHNERLLIWKERLPGSASLEPGIDHARIAMRYELSGGMIMSVVRHASLQAIARRERVLRHQDRLDGIRREYAKESRVE